LRVRARRLSGFVPSAGRRSEVRTVAPTSLSDNVRYPDFCRRAAHNSRVFAQFRRDPGYMSVLGLDEKWGWKYFEALTPDSPAARLIPEAAAKDDLIGDPITLTLPDGIAVAPTTLRYLKVADDLERLFGSLDGGSVCEIGAGYGGQCRVLDALWPLRSYTLVDLRPVLSLAERYLAHFALNCQARFRTMNELPVESYDLFISNYAFSELAGHIQEAYFRKAIAATPRGYVLFNDLGSRNRGGMTAERLCELTGGRLLPEEPLTHPRNRLIVWGA
jgi:putative sugar O-methyltransferase